MKPLITCLAFVLMLLMWQSSYGQAKGGHATANVASVSSPTQPGTVSVKAPTPKPVIHPVSPSIHTGDRLRQVQPTAPIVNPARKTKETH